MSDNSWDNLNINIGYAGMYEDQPDESPSSRDTNTPEPYMAITRSGIYSTPDVVDKPPPGKIRSFSGKVSVFLFGISLLFTCIFFFSASILSIISLTFHTSDTTAKSCLTWLFLSIPFVVGFCILAAKLDPS